MTRKVRYLIIGAGPAGLGAGYRLKQLEESDFLILERDAHVGGLAASFRDEKGFTWDIGGHVQFSHYDYFDDLMDTALGEEGWLQHQRESWVWIEGRYVPYPLQNNIRYLNKLTLWKCLEGLIAAKTSGGRKSPENFRQWIETTFGTGLADAFMLPYNFKVWAYPPEDLGTRWMGERVAVPDLVRVMKNILFNLDDLSWGPNSVFRFPKRGGTGATWQQVAGKIGSEHIQLSSPVAAIDHAKKQLTLNSGETLAYEHLLSTMPLDILCRKLQSAPAHWREAAGQLVHSSSNIVGIGLRGQVPEALRTKCWMYFPENDCPFYRVTVFSNYSPANVPDGSQFWSLMAETSESGKKPVEVGEIAEETIQGCLNTQLLRSREDIVSVWHHRVEHGYPVPSTSRDQALNLLLPELDAVGIASRGRFGAWKYEVSNQDHSLMQGVEWVNKLMQGTPEATVFHPDLVNAHRPRPRGTPVTAKA